MAETIDTTIKIDPIEPAMPRASGERQAGYPGSHLNHQEHRESHETSTGMDAEDHFERLSKATRRANQLLMDQQLPYRFCIYKREDDHIFIDFVFLDSEGKIEKTVERNITHENFFKWISHIESGKGLILDMLK